MKKTTRKYKRKGLISPSSILVPTSIFIKVIKIYSKKLVAKIPMISGLGQYIWEIRGLIIKGN